MNDADLSAARVILASASPRRLELLRQIGIAAHVHPADIAETPRSGETATDYVKRMAHEKAAAVASFYTDDSLIIGADTSVIVDQQIIGKPANIDEFRAIFTQLSGRSHDVLTAVSVITCRQHNATVCNSRVWFRAIDANEIDTYWASGEPVDKAGGYGIQGAAALYIKKIAGSYSGIMGLPLYETGQLLAQSGYQLKIKG